MSTRWPAGGPSSGCRGLNDNLTELQPVVFDGVGSADLPQVVRARSPDPYVSLTRDLLASDVMTVARGTLSLPFEEREKELLRVSEALGLRGAGIDPLRDTGLDVSRAEAVRPAVAEVRELVLTVVDGDFPADLLRDQNLGLARWTMPPTRIRPTAGPLRLPGPRSGSTGRAPTDKGARR